ncbi:chaperone protein dnaJ 8, chloroplastic isoform X2 [Manihot esculenta]|uniref:chaperone protein dnaJ 8, chloroplastic isoform X2 n=1 Tax=Manihot esculenta TaxID=3983 RepID=UPI001CC45677|nr:chaperone protein dnaJ 8, chloroplastic isoform X2 [Manihot esculenta]
MASAAVGMIGSNGCAGSSSSSWFQIKNRRKKNINMGKNRVRFLCVSSSSSVMDPYKTLRIQPGASESEVRKAFRQLALQIVMSSLRGEADESQMSSSSYEPYDEDEPMRGMNDPDWDMWEEWMGWEGAGIRDYTSHINPYI